MGKYVTLATVAAGAIILSACNKPATENVAAPAMEATDNMMNAPEAMNSAAPMAADNGNSAMGGDNMMPADNAMNATDPHGSSSGH
jgi:PBP1b-binding outer membrane lipoprotein LpoB